MSECILIIDTAHPTARVVLVDEEKTFAVKEWENTPKVGTDVLVYIDELLRDVGKVKADITRVGVHAGPGSYALLRTGIGTATILAQAIGAQLVAVEGEAPEELVQSAKNATPTTSIEPKYKT